MKHFSGQKAHEFESCPGLETVKITKNLSSFGAGNKPYTLTFSIHKINLFTLLASITYLELSKFKQINTGFCVLWIAFDISKGVQKTSDE